MSARFRDLSLPPPVDQPVIPNAVCGVRNLSWFFHAFVGAAFRGVSSFGLGALAPALRRGCEFRFNFHPIRHEKQAVILSEESQPRVLTPRETTVIT